MTLPPWKVGALASPTGMSVRARHHYDEIELLTPALHIAKQHEHIALQSRRVYRRRSEDRGGGDDDVRARGPTLQQLDEVPTPEMFVYMGKAFAPMK